MYYNSGDQQRQVNVSLDGLNATEPLPVRITNIDVRKKYSVTATMCTVAGCGQNSDPPCFIPMIHTKEPSDESRSNLFTIAVQVSSASSPTPPPLLRFQWIVGPSRCGSRTFSFLVSPLPSPPLPSPPYPPNRGWSLTWPAAMFGLVKRMNDKNRVQFPEDCFTPPTWPQFLFFCSFNVAAVISSANTLYQVWVL